MPRAGPAAAAVAASASAGLVLALSCGPQRAAVREVPAPGDVVIQVGALDVTERELNAHVEFARRIDPIVAEAHARRVYLQDWILPRQVVVDLVPAERRAEVRRRAETLASAVAERGGTVEALRLLGAQYGLRDDAEFLAPARFEVGVGEAVFATAIGRVTGAIHGVAGSTVAGVVAERLERGVPHRRIVAVHLPWQENLQRAKIRAGVEAIRQQPAWVHPRYAEELSTFFHAALRTEPLREPTIR